MGSGAVTWCNAGVPSLAATTPTPTPRLTPVTTPTHQPALPAGLRAPIITHSYSFDDALSKFPAGGLAEGDFPEICVTNVMGDEIKLFITQEPMDESA
jgi:hypothetical protein